MVGLTRKQKYEPVPIQYSPNRALIGLCSQTVHHAIQVWRRLV